MEFSEYNIKTKEITSRVGGYPNQGCNILYTVIALSEEAGECAGAVKKAMRASESENPPIYFGGKTGTSWIADNESGNELRRAILLEMGDVLWYLNAMANELDSSLQEVAGLNIAKLLVREKEGTTLATTKRKEKK